MTTLWKLLKNNDLFSTVTITRFSPDDFNINLIHNDKYSLNLVVLIYLAMSLLNRIQLIFLFLLNKLGRHN